MTQLDVDNLIRTLDGPSLNDLGIMLAQQGRTREAERLLVAAAETGLATANLNLGRLLADLAQEP